MCSYTMQLHEPPSTASNRNRKGLERPHPNMQLGVACGAAPVRGLVRTAVAMEKIKYKIDDCRGVNTAGHCGARGLCSSTKPSKSVIMKDKCRALIK